MSQGGPRTGDATMDRALGDLYDRQGGLEGSNPQVARWLGDIRQYFPNTMVEVMQKDALEKLKLTQLLTDPKVLETLEVNVHLATTLMSLSETIPNECKATARIVIRKLVEDLEKRLRTPLLSAIKGALNRAERNYRPKYSEINWDRTIRKNLKHYQASHGTIIPERLVGHSHRSKSQRDVILALDESGSMAASVVYASVFASVMASLRSLTTKIIAFDTSVVDLTEMTSDPVDMLFAVQLGGGTDIRQALEYSQRLITRPEKTIYILISDLEEGGSQTVMLERAQEIVASGVTAICLLALDDQGNASYNREYAQAYADFGFACFSCTPDLFPQMMAAAINRENMAQWASASGLKTYLPK